MEVTEIMSTDVVTAEVGVSLQTVVERMLEHGVGSVVITDDRTPAGLITETDALTAAARSGRPLADIPAAEVMTRPVKTVEANATVSRVMRRMAEHGIKKLPVMDGIELVGIVTYTDLVHEQANRDGVLDAGDYFSEPV